MITRTAETSPQIRARVAGALYLSLALFAPFSQIYVPSKLIVSGDAATTVSNIAASGSLFSLGIVSALVTAIINILVALALYQVLKLVHRNTAWLMVILILVSIPITMLNELNNSAILFLVSGAGSLKGLTADQMHALVSLFLNLHATGLNIAGIFFGLWLFPMGYLVFKSGFLPRLLGVLLIIGGVGYVVQSFAALLLPNFNVSIVLFTDWGELLFPLWLVIRGVNIKQWERRALAF